MTKAEERALEAYPYNSAYTDNDVEYDGNFCNRLPYIEGYEQAENDTIERACEWWKIHLEGIISDGLIDGILQEFRKAMEEEQ